MSTFPEYESVEALATFLLDDDDSLLYEHRDAGMLGFSATMNRPLSFLDPYLN